MIDIRSLKCIAAAIVVPLLLAPESLAQFETRSSSEIIYDPQAVAVGDFNHDGKLDVAATAWYTGQVAILLGNGDGTFRTPTYYTIDNQLESVNWVVVADFRGNGNLDLAVSDFLGGNISILLGNGDGTFQPPVQYRTTAEPSLVAVGDFNKDGKPDLILSDWPYVSVMLGNGDGTFQGPIDNSIFSGGTFALGDFNHDGNLDVAVIGGGNLNLGILLGNGDGTFREGAQQYAVGEFANSITVGDFNQDHKLDLAVANGSIGNQIYVLLGNGDGTFQSQPPLSANEPLAITNADVNGDGKLDLLFITLPLPNPLNQFTVMLGNGNGSFQPPVSYPSFAQATDIVVGDFNGDHKPDVAIADFSGGSAVDILLNTGTVTFSPTTPLSFSPQLLSSTSTAQNVTLTNTNTLPLSITSISTTPPFQLASGTTCRRSVASGAKCNLSVVFHPTTLGLKNGLLSVNDSASSKPQVIALSGTGTTLTVSPSQLNFGSQKVFTKSPPQNVTLTNTGSVAVSITGVSFTGSAALDYSQTNTCGAQINPGAACTVSYVFDPNRKGTRSAAAQINGPDGAIWQEVALTGTGT